MLGLLAVTFVCLFPAQEAVNLGWRTWLRILTLRQPLELSERELTPFERREDAALDRAIEITERAAIPCVMCEIAALHACERAYWQQQLDHLEGRECADGECICHPSCPHCGESLSVSLPAAHTQAAKPWATRDASAVPELLAHVGVLQAENERLKAKQSASVFMGPFPEYDFGGEDELAVSDGE